MTQNLKAQLQAENLKAQLRAMMPTSLTGRVVRTSGVTAAAAGFPAPIGSVVEIERQAGEPIRGEVVGFQQGHTIICPYYEVAGVRQGNSVRLARTSRFVRVGNSLLGRVLDAHGQPLAQRRTGLQPVPIHGAQSRAEHAPINGPVANLSYERVSLHRRPPPPVERSRIDAPLSTGIRAIDGMLTCGMGQRMGIFAGSGVGKSVMLGMMARHTSADVNVIGLIGERGREVNEFLERDLGARGLARSVVVVATSDESALLRVQAAMTATAIAEYFRDQNRNVLLMMDSLTRFAMAQREIGLAAGEPPATRGYPPSVMALLPKLVERAGPGLREPARGSITAFYSVLVEGDDENEPVSDMVRGLLDGHTVLSRKIAARGRYPAIDILASISRLMPSVTPAEHQRAAALVRELISVYRDNEDLISIGAYPGGDAKIDAARSLHGEVEAFLQQSMNQTCTLESAREALMKLAGTYESAAGGKK